MRMATVVVLLGERWWGCGQALGQRVQHRPAGPGTACRCGAGLVPVAGRVTPLSACRRAAARGCIRLTRRVVAGRGRRMGLWAAEERLGLWRVLVAGIPWEGAVRVGPHDLLQAYLGGAVAADGGARGQRGGGGPGAGGPVGPGDEGG